MEFAALCAVGLEKLVRQELKALGLKPLESQKHGLVLFSDPSPGGPGPGAVRALVHLRCAERVLALPVRGRASHFEELFERIAAAPWGEWIPAEAKIEIDRVRLTASQLTAPSSVQAVAQKALMQTLADHYGVNRLEESGRLVQFRLYLDHDELLFGFDLTGLALHRRGYRAEQGEAPLRETLAAALLLWSGWRRKFPLVDVFCGSGTLLFEALMFAENRAPGLGRDFAFQALQGFDPAWLTETRREAEAQIRRDVTFHLRGRDLNPAVVETARANARRMGWQDRVLFEVGDMAEARPLAEETPEGFLISNPPYGERLDSKAQARELGRACGPLMDRFAGWRAGFLTTLEDWPGLMRRTVFAHRRLQNGPLSLHYFQL